jgi:hypothetical protein
MHTFLWAACEDAIQQTMPPKIEGKVVAAELGRYLPGMLQDK